jgi:hypothetical protein
MGRPRSRTATTREDRVTVSNVSPYFSNTVEWSLWLDVFSLFDSRANDIDYFYVSRLPGEPTGGSPTCTSTRSSHGRSA